MNLVHYYASKIFWEYFPLRLNNQVLKTVGTNTFIFWKITPCSLMKVNPPLGATYLLNLQVRIADQVRNQ